MRAGIPSRLQDPHPDLLPDGRERGRAKPVVLFASFVMPARAGIQI